MVLSGQRCPCSLQLGSGYCRPDLVAFGGSVLDEAVLAAGFGRHRKKNVTW
jgi:hypothetical protein